MLMGFQPYLFSFVNPAIMRTLSEFIKNFSKKRLFIILLCVSGLIHWVLIANAHRIKVAVMPDLSNPLRPGNTDNIIIEFVLNEEDDNNKDYLVKEKKDKEIATEKIKEEKKEDPKEKKRRLFVDTDQLETDEQTQVESDMIGEKGSIVRDKLANEDDITNKPNSQGDTEILSLVKGGYAYATGPKEIGRYDLISKGNQSSVIENQSNEKLMGSKSIIGETSMPQEDKYLDTRDALNVLNVDKVMEYHGKDEDVKTIGDLASQTDPEKEKSLIDYEGEKGKPDKLNTLAEDMPPFHNLKSYEDGDINIAPEEIYKNKEKDAKEGQEIEDAPEGEGYKKSAYLSKKEEDKILKKLSEISEDHSVSDQGSLSPDGAAKPKVAISINAKGGNRAPSMHQYKDKLSNAALYGEPTFNIKKDEYAPYYKHIRDKISLYWQLYFGTDHSINLETKEHSPIIIDFKILPSGKVVDVKIVEDAGNPFLASRTQTSVKNTRLDVFPPYINEKFIDVRFNFYFF